MKFTLYHADCLEIPGNCTYQHKVEVTDKDSLLQAVLLTRKKIGRTERMW